MAGSIPPKQSHKQRLQTTAASQASRCEALAEVLQQLDEEDEEDSHGDSDDMDYVEERATASDDWVGENDSIDGGTTRGKTKPIPKKHRKTGKQRESAMEVADDGHDSSPGSGPLAGGFTEGLLMYWRSWESFNEAFADFQEATFQQFSSLSSTSVDRRNRQIAAQDRSIANQAKVTEHCARRKKRTTTGGTLLPESWKTYCRTIVCTHGMPFDSKSSSERGHTKVRATGCTARVNARVKLRPSDSGFHLVMTGTGAHNHNLSPHTWYNYAENRQVADQELRQEVVIMSKAGAKPKGILAYLRAKTDKRTSLCDVHNIIQDVKKSFKGGRTDAERLLSVLDEFCEGDPGNTSEFVVDADSGVIRVVTFQSARMKRLFAAFPEVVLVDSTHGTNVNRYKLFSFAVHDVFGRGQYVQHALVQTEEKSNLAEAVAAFNKKNPDWTKIRVVMTDKTIHEKDVLLDAWPNARQLLCKWHVETWLKRQCSRLEGFGPVETRQLKIIMKGLVNADSQQKYDDLKAALLSSVGDDKENLLYMSFMTHWDTSPEEWVMFKRGGVPHLKNNTNNRLESKWDRVKEIVDGNFTIDQLISMLMTMQAYAEERYLAESHRVGSRPPMAEDPDLTAVAMQLSEYAFRMVAEQHKLTVGPHANYDITAHGDKTSVTNPATGETHEVDARRSSCDCIFMQTCLLPCRHVMYVRSLSNYETVTPPTRTFNTRWIVRSSANNINEGVVLRGGVNRVNCPPIRNPAPIDRDAKYNNSKRLTEKINRGSC